MNEKQYTRAVEIKKQLEALTKLRELTSRYYINGPIYETIEVLKQAFPEIQVDIDIETKNLKDEFDAL